MRAKSSINFASIFFLLWFCKREIWPNGNEKCVLIILCQEKAAVNVMFWKIISEFFFHQKKVQILAQMCVLVVCEQTVLLCSNRTRNRPAYLQYIEMERKPHTYTRRDEVGINTETHSYNVLYCTHATLSRRRMPRNVWYRDAKRGKKWNHDKDNAKLSTYSTSWYDTARLTYTHNWVYFVSKNTHTQWTLTSKNFNNEIRHIKSISSMKFCAVKITCIWNERARVGHWVRRRTRSFRLGLFISCLLIYLNGLLRGEKTIQEKHSPRPMHHTSISTTHFTLCLLRNAQMCSNYFVFRQNGFVTWDFIRILTMMHCTHTGIEEWKHKPFEWVFNF